MTKYLVSWECDIEAESPQDAARQMYEMMISPDTYPPYFDVLNTETNKRIGVDMEKLLSEDN